MNTEAVRPNHKTWLLLLQRAGAVACLAVLAACSSAPGMHLDADSAALRARADLLSIDLATVQQLRAQSRSLAQRQQALPTGFQGSASAGPQGSAPAGAQSSAPAGVQSSAPAGVQSSAPAGLPPYQYRVAPQDILQVTVWNRPELNNPSNTSNELSGRIVNADGTLYYPFVGAFVAAGKTVQEIRDHITNGLMKVIKQPQVDVSVLQYRSQRVYVSGEVRTPGTVPVTDIPPDLTEIIARAGGTTNEADLSGVTVTRGRETLRLDLQALYYAGNLRSNIRLQHGDIVNVPERRASKVFVTGEVIRPTALLLPRGPFTLADALADAGGVNPLSANAGQIYVLRGTVSGNGSGASNGIAHAGAETRSKIYHLNAAAPDALLLADQFELQARDVVYVDAASVVRWARVMSNVLAPANLVREVLNDTVRGLPR